MTITSWHFNPVLIAHLVPVLAATAIACSASDDAEPIEPDDGSNAFAPPLPASGAASSPEAPAPGAAPTGAEPPLPPMFGPMPGAEPAPPPQNAPLPPPSDLGTAEPAAPPPPPVAGQVAGAEFLRRIAGTWTGINSNTPIGFDFPLTVSFAPSSDSFMFGKFEIDPENNVLWGFNVENYGNGDVLAYRNGGYLLGLRRDSRTALVEYDTEGGYYRFCAVKESGFPVDGCNYIDARYTFSAPDRMLFEVFTRGTDPHVHWEAARVEAPALDERFPASLASQGDGSVAWPAAAGMDR
jgi:hypothetical protein